MTFKSLAPGFLIASPPLGDPNFDRTVVLLAAHDEDGALGFVVNRVAPLTVGELFGHAGYEGCGHDASPVWLGGPVQPRSGWLVIEDGRMRGDAVIPLGPRLRVTSSREAFDKVARQLAAQPDNAAKRAPRRMVVLGYSGWGRSQLENEIGRGSWLPTPLDASILFDVAPADRWSGAFALMGLTPTHLMTMRTVGEA
ncbi:MAG: YqgE/AlgH family protein [Myxococcales bacterium]|nr:YqgE/AlgH family protein [Myxococcales bacterium]